MSHVEPVTYLARRTSSSRERKTRLDRRFSEKAGSRTRGGSETESDNYLVVAHLLLRHGKYQ